MRSLGLALSALFSALALTGCGERLSPSYVSSAPTEATMRAAAANNHLGFAVLAELARGAPEEQPNVLISPLSISTTLSMLSAGAAGGTAAALHGALGFPEGADALSHGFGELGQSLADFGPGGPELASANRLWLQKGVTVEASYDEMLRRAFGAATGEVDFAADPAAAVTAVNQWTSEQTHGTIQDLLSGVAKETELVLTDALYFKGEWQTPFASDMTADGTFTAEGKSMPVRMMARTGMMLYAETDALQAVELPYAHGSLVMDVVIPKDGKAAPWAQAGFEGQVEILIANLARRTVVLHLPGFTETAAAALKEPLAAAGFGSAFRSDADFSGITGKRGLKLDDVAHKAFIAVTEKGTEAGAATAAVVVGTGVAGEPVQCRADHPFVYVIRDTESRAVLFLGVMADASAG